MNSKTNSLARSMFIALLVLFSSSVFAQKTVTGKVTNKTDNQPIMGASVQVKGTNIGTQTNAEGNFSIKASSSQFLSISVVGYEPVEMEVGDKSIINFSLTPSSAILDEVLVTGYTSQKKKDITGSVSVVNVSDLESIPATTAENQLQGRVAGVTVIGNNEPGSVSSVRIRGFASFGGNDPLFIVDGVPAGSLLGINPEDIETMQVLKDAASASIYGSRASNGVIIVTTKKGKPGGAKVSYSMQYGSQNPGKGYSNFLTPQEQADLTWQALKNSGQDLNHGQYGSGPKPILPDYLLAGTSSGLMEGDPAVNPSLYDLNFNKLGDDNYTPYLIVKANKQGTNWFKELTRTAPFVNHNLTVSGGSPDKSRYMFSFNYLNKDGIQIENYYKRYTARINTEFNIKNNIRIGENIQIYASESNSAGINSEGTEIGYGYRILPIIPVRNINGDLAGTLGANLGNSHNPVAVRERSKNDKGLNFNLFGNMYAEIDFLQHFTVRTSFGGTLSNYNYYSYPKLEYESSENNVDKTYQEGFGKYNSWTWTNQITYKNNFGNHHVQALAGIESVADKGRSISGTRLGYYSYTNLSYINLNTGTTINALNGSPYNESALYSQFGRIDYDFKGKYLLSGTIRRDGSSRFAESNRYGYFPAGSVGWRITEESFMENVRWLTDLKVRASYGSMGNQRISSTNQFTQFGGGTGASYYDINGTSIGTVEGFYIPFIGNAAGKWETNITSNAGFDATLFNGNTEVSFDIYQKKTKDLLFNAERPATSGGAAANNPPAFNIASMKNWGIDIAATQRANINGIKFDATLTFTTYKNLITDIAPGVTSFDQDAGEGGRINGVFTRNAVGHPLGSYFGYQVIGLWKNDAEVNTANEQAQKVAGDPEAAFQKDAAPGRFRYKDANGDGMITEDDRVFFGNPNPKFSYGLNLNFAYKGFDVSAFFYGVQGKDAINYVRWWTDFYPSFQGAKSKDALYNSWSPSNPNAKVPIQENEGNFSTNGIPNSYYMENASYLRMKNLSIGYNLPKEFLKRFGIDRLRIYVQATNLFTITKYTGLDPEIINVDGNGNPVDGVSGIDAGAYPTVKQFTAGLNLNF